MWILTLRPSDGEPKEYTPKPGLNSIGRRSDVDIPISDISASRFHAEVHYDPTNDTLRLKDMGSTNGTFVNRERISQEIELHHNDVIRIGGYLINVTYIDPMVKKKPVKSGTRPLTRELLLESLDQHAVLMYEVSRQLNTVFDLETALHQVSSLIRRTMGADRCEVITTEQFHQLGELGFPTTIAQMAIDQRATVIIPDAEAEHLGDSASLYRIRSALCVPIISGDDTLGLIYMYKTDPAARPFDQRDLQLAVAISHQAALTIQRMQLLEQVRQEQRVRELLQRFLSPPEAEFILQDYLITGRLPELTERKATILFTDIADSTELAEDLGPKRFGEVLGRYYQEMTDIIFEHGGLLDKYLGDGIMSVFGLIDEKGISEVRAVEAGLEMLKRLEVINKEEGLEIQIGISVNTGPVMAGYLGTKQRVELTILGDTVNVASRLQAQARPNRLLVGPATVASIVGHFNTQRIGAVTVKGRTKPIQVHEVILPKS
jgi:adenylate cyclase